MDSKKREHSPDRDLPDRNVRLRTEESHSDIADELTPEGTDQNANQEEVNDESIPVEGTGQNANNGESREANQNENNSSGQLHLLVNGEDWNLPQDNDFELTSATTTQNNLTIKGHTTKEDENGNIAMSLDLDVSHAAKTSTEQVKLHVDVTISTNEPDSRDDESEGGDDDSDSENFEDDDDDPDYFEDDDDDPDYFEDDDDPDYFEDDDDYYS